MLRSYKCSKEIQKIVRLVVCENLKVTGIEKGSVAKDEIPEK